MEDGRLLIYSEVGKDRMASCGVGCILKQYRKIYLKEYSVEINQGKNEIYTVLVYTPNQEETIAAKEQLWENLTITTENNKGHIIVFADFNTRVGRKDNTTDSAIGKHDEDKRNNNSRRLLDFVCSLIERDTQIYNKSLEQGRRVYY